MIDMDRYFLTGLFIVAVIVWVFVLFVPGGW